MEEDRKSNQNEPIERESVSALSDDQISKEAASAAATSQPESRADKFSNRIKQFPSDELELYVEGRSLIGSGGFADVRKYQYKDKTVAVKEFAIAGDDTTIAKIWNMVLREANILCRFQHENIVEILGVTQWPNIVGIIMEYVDGGNLQSLLSEDNQSKLPWNDRLQIANGITSGLDYIHNYGEDKKFCHGDLKPANILLTQSLQVKLADFGSAAFHRATAASATTTSKVSTTQFTLIYVAPEFLVDNTQKRCPTMDMYSFGMVLYELISGKAPYSDSSMPNVVPALIMAKIKPSGKLIDEAENRLESDGDRVAFNMLKKLMEKCWNNDPDSRPDSKAVKMELSSSVVLQQQSSTSTNHGKETVVVEAAASEEEKAAADNGSTKQKILEKATMEEIFKALDVVLPKQTSGEKEVEKTTLENLFQIFGTSTLLGNNTSVQNFLAQYTDSLLNKNFEQADIFRAALRALIMNDINAEAEDVRVFGERLHKEEKYLQSIAIFDTSAALFAKMKNPNDDLERIQFCVQGMKLANGQMINDDTNMMVIVRDHVLPLMRGWLRQMKSATQVSEKWRCHVVSWALSNIESCELRVGLIEARKQTLEEAVSGMRRVFGPDVYKQQGRLFGSLLNNLGIVYKSESRFEEAAVLFKDAVEAHKEADDYFGDEEDRTKELKTSEQNLKTSLVQAWEKQLKMK